MVTLGLIMLGLDLLGAGEALASQTIQLRITSIDPDKLRKGLGAGAWGAALAPALAVVDEVPKLAIDMVVPVLKSKLEAMGITADVSATDTPAAPRAPSEAAAGLFVGGVLGAVLAIIGRWAYYRLKGKG